MKRLLYSLFCLLLLAPKSVFAARIDQINNFSSDVTINRDTSISIKETIDYETSLEKHGIYRYIPIRYNKDNISYSARVENINVTNQQDKMIQFEKTEDNRNITLKIGSPNTTFTGKKTYIITYTVKNALQEFADHDELYWDITGEGWQIPVLRSSAIIHSSVADIKNVICYTGPIGDNDGKCTSIFESSKANFEYPQTVNYGDNFTVAIAFIKPNQIQFPTASQKMLKKVQDNFLIVIPFLPVLLMFWIWYKKGRDWTFISPNVFNLDQNQPQRLKPIFASLNMPFVYEPLKDLTPGEAGLLLDERVDNQDVIAEIIDLARKKYLSITTIEKKHLFSTSKDYLFKLNNGEWKTLPEHQRFLIEKLFATSDEVELSDLKGSFYNHIARTKSLIEKSLYQKKAFSSNPGSIRALYIVLGIILSVFVLLSALFIGDYLLVSTPFVALLSIPLIFIFCWNMIQKTAMGTNLSLQAKGLRETIRRGAWREKIMEKNLFFEEMLPFAIAMGVVKQLARDMEQLNIQSPQYFSDPMIRSMGFNSFINSFSSQASSSLSYNPSSSSSSGGSGFSGGSSGGGGGGGGGGSW